MFYNQLMKLCKERNIKPTPLAKTLGISPSNIKRWEEGATVNSDILAMMSEYFDVPVDYFFEEDGVSEQLAIADDGNSIKKVYHVMSAHSDHIASMISGMSVSFSDLKRIAAYMNCSVDYLVQGEVPQEVSSDNPAKSVISDKDFILNALEKLAGNPEYRYFQVKISSIIISNLAKKNITLDRLLELKLAEKKIRDLCDSTVPAEKKKGLNFSDLVRISEAFNVSYDYMLTGNGE